MNSPFGSPSPSQQSGPAPRNYAEVFDPRDYEGKSDIELESYARNLHNYIKTLLPQNPFPAILFDKLEKRLDGITSMLTKRYAAKGVLNRTQAKDRWEKLGQRLDAFAAEEPELLERPSKRQRVEPPCQKEVREELEALRHLRKSYAEKQPEEEED